MKAQGSKKAKLPQPEATTPGVMYAVEHRPKNSTGQWGESYRDANRDVAVATARRQMYETPSHEYRIIEVQEPPPCITHEELEQLGPPPLAELIADGIRGWLQEVCYLSHTYESGDLCPDEHLEKMTYVRDLFGPTTQIVLRERIATKGAGIRTDRDYVQRQFRISVEEIEPYTYRKEGPKVKTGGILP